jgi:hypothetical protein
MDYFYYQRLTDMKHLIFCFTFLFCFQTVTSQEDHYGIWRGVKDTNEFAPAFYDLVLYKPGEIVLLNGAFASTSIYETDSVITGAVSYSGTRDGNCLYYYTVATQKYHYLFTWAKNRFVIYGQNNRVLQEFYKVDSIQLSRDEKRIFFPKKDEGFQWQHRKADQHDYNCKISERELVNSYRYPSGTNNDLLLLMPLPKYYLTFNADKKKYYVAPDTLNPFAGSSKYNSQNYFFTQMKNEEISITIGLQNRLGKFNETQLLKLSGEAMYMAKSDEDRINGINVIFIYRDKKNVYQGGEHCHLYFKSISKTDKPNEFMVELYFNITGIGPVNKLELTNGNLKGIFVLK